MMAMGEVIDVADLPPSLQRCADERVPPHSAAGPAPSQNGAGSALSFEDHEKQLLTQVLTQTGGNQSKAARQLRIGRDALRYKMKKYGLL
jgi:DNA-binding NtrC family response regulator